MNKLMFWINVGIAAVVFILVLKYAVNAVNAPAGLKTMVNNI
jgi:hypothetical protein